MNVTERKQLEEKLRESFLCLEGVVDSLKDAVVVADEGQRIIVFNRGAQRMFGCSKQEAIGSSIDRLFSEPLLAAYRTYIQNFSSRGPTTQTVESTGGLGGLRTAGAESPTEASMSETTAGGKRLFTIIIRDITERKKAEQALFSLSRRLIEAQEEERTWIARELHDDISQRIALLSVSLEALEQGLPASEVQTSRRIQEARELVSDLGSDIQSLSHRLHSTKLEYLGLEGAGAGLCRELSERNNVEIDFQSRNVPKKIPQEIELCLFRVLQEALQNAIKHSGVKHFAVSLTGESNEIELSVQDSGVGFEPEKAISGGGLGLASMKERLTLVRGQLTVDSKLQHGTTIRARVPLSPGMNSRNADG
jgi:PAS domain S-box-containing protein